MLLKVTDVPMAESGFCPTGCFTNTVVIRLSSAVRSMVLLGAVRQDGYYFLTLWTVGDSSLCLWGYTMQWKVVNCQSRRLFALVFLLKRCHTKPHSTWRLFILFTVQIVVILWALVMCRLLQRWKGYKGWRSEKGTVWVWQSC